MCHVPTQELDLCNIPSHCPPRPSSTRLNYHHPESNVRFGLFMLTLMYFRAIYYLRRELRAKEAKEKAAADLAAGNYSPDTKCLTLIRLTGSV